MCQTYTFYHLCGHIHSKPAIQCSISTAALLSQPIPSPDTNVTETLQTPSYPRRNLCSDSISELQIAPSPCASCSEIGLISTWFERSPTARFDTIRAWKAKIRDERGCGGDERGRVASMRGSLYHGRSAARAGSESAVPLLVADEGSCDSSSADESEHGDLCEAETMAFIALGEVVGVAMDAELGMKEDDDKFVGQDVTRVVANVNASRTEDVRRRIVALKERISKTLAKSKPA